MGQRCLWTVDLGYGECRMIVAEREGDNALAESLRRLGAVRVATNTAAPAWARRSAMALPMPRPAPVTIAV